MPQQEAGLEVEQGLKPNLGTVVWDLHVRISTVPNVHSNSGDFCVTDD